VPERPLRRKVTRFAAVGMRSLFAQEPEPAQRTLLNPHHSTSAYTCPDIQ